MAKNDPWMDYIDAEVREACRMRGWKHQIRRKGLIREKPVFESGVDDYEWKLIPGADDATYYVLSFDSQAGKFVLQHDTSHWGVPGPHWLVSTYSEIRIPSGHDRMSSDAFAQRSDERLPERWLSDYLLDLTARFKPNHFSAT